MAGHEEKDGLQIGRETKQKRRRDHAADQAERLWRRMEDLPFHTPDVSFATFQRSNFSALDDCSWFDGATTC
jgi:hypothetical protein